MPAPRGVVQVDIVADTPKERTYVVRWVTDSTGAACAPLHGWPIGVLHLLSSETNGSAAANYEIELLDRMGADHLSGLASGSALVDSNPATLVLSSAVSTRGVRPLALYGEPLDFQATGAASLAGVTRFVLSKTLAAWFNHEGRAR